ncbi:hypothetical protein BD410DRAFT_722468 [Rickenella mellea]|uniref:DASH complex subunit DAM1 n=1 Tax=Rickenella mellea TaxID=50990 RepID=A0A4Y7Q640_9AGAM|nr:hypothetical protein BD410DRAFT_722468 [Rickenella mellea]
MPAPTAPRTPLRRVSQGSLRALSRSGVFPDAPYGLGFLEPVMAELADEVEGLHANVEGLHALSRSLDSFNESFASFLYVMEMNALTTDWPQVSANGWHVPIGKAKSRYTKNSPKQAQLALQAAITTASEPTTSGLDDTTVGDATYANTTMAQAGPSKPVSILKNGGPKKKAKPKLTAKERKERSLAIDKTVSCLPLEFRGQDPNLRRHVEAVIEGLMDSESNGIRMIDLIKPPDLNQARVNKCLIALANRKIVSKDKSTGEILYVWGGVPT